MTVTGDVTTFSLRATYIPHFGGRIVALNGFDIDFIRLDTLSTFTTRINQGLSAMSDEFRRP
ncbi:hypothetical protein PO124_16400 [Bacillus licheniformis]|nr:hypothetical protein [Bacillus licheniformis]